MHDSTALAVPAILDGRYPRPGLRSDVYSHPANLFTLLERRYEVHAFEEATGLCPTSLCEPPAGTTASHLSHGKLARFREFVRTVERRAAPALWFKHVAAAARPVAVLSVRAPLSPERAGADPRAERRARVRACRGS